MNNIHPPIHAMNTYIIEAIADTTRKKMEITGDLFDITSDDSPVVVDSSVRDENLVLLIMYVSKKFNHVGFILVQVIGTGTGISKIKRISGFTRSKFK